MSAFKVWEVRGCRALGGGASAELTATSFGATEGHARKAFHRLFNNGTGKGTAGEHFRWADHELTFTPLAEGGAK